MGLSRPRRWLCLHVLFVQPQVALEAAGAEIPVQVLQNVLWSPSGFPIWRAAQIKHVSMDSCDVQVLQNVLW